MVSSAVEHCPHTTGATGSNPVPPTMFRGEQAKGLACAGFERRTDEASRLRKEPGARGRLNDGETGTCDQILYHPPAL